MKSALHVFGLCLCSLLAVGCDMSFGGNGYVSFSDETDLPGFNLRLGVRNDIAKGATLNIKMSGSDLRTSRVYSDQPNVVSIEKVEDNTITVSAHEIGSARLHVDLEDGRSDYLDVTVTQTATNTIELYPWHDFIALDRSLWSNGISLLPNTNLTVFGRARSADGKLLTGIKSADWTVDTSGDASIEPSEDSDFAVYKSGSMIGDSGLKFGRSDRQPLPTIAQTEVTELRLIFPFGEPTTVSAGGQVYLHAALFAANGNYVVGIGDGPVAFDAAKSVELEKRASDGEVEGVVLSNGGELERAFTVGRAISFQADQPGVYTVFAAWGNLETSVEIEVVERPQSDTEIMQ